MKIALSLLIAALLLWHSVASAFEDDFNNSLDWSIWCPCQINMDQAPVEFRTESGISFARIIADEASLGGKKCYPECRVPEATFDEKAGPESERPDRPEPLGPSLIPLLKGKTRSVLLKEDSETRYCTPEVLKRAAAREEGKCMQRQELRVQKTHVHLASAAHFYTIRFRMPGRIENQTDSIRWVTAQWKHDESRKYEDEFGKAWDGASPFLAQRFDDGVLHVTVQDEHCRCVVAAAPMRGRPNRIWQNGKAKYCLSTRPGDAGNTPCKTELQVEYGSPRVLPSARGRWVELKYRVQASRSEDARIEVYNGEKLVVKVTGKIGYEPADNSKTKFKIGHYRAYQPFGHAMDIDRIKVEPAP